MSITNTLYNNVRAIQDQVYKKLGREYLPNVIILGRNEWAELNKEQNREWSSIFDRVDYEKPRFMGIPVEVVNRESYMSIDYRWPLYIERNQQDPEVENAN